MLERSLATGRDVNLQQAALAGGLSAGVGALQDRLSPPMSMHQALTEDDLPVEARKIGPVVTYSEQQFHKVALNVKLHLVAEQLLLLARQRVQETLT
jgi:hypothetical protein